MYKISEELGTGIEKDRCSYMKCLLCHIDNCMTGQAARNHGRAAYDQEMAELEYAHTHDN